MINVQKHSEAFHQLRLKKIPKMSESKKKNSLVKENIYRISQLGLRTFKSYQHVFHESDCFSLALFLLSVCRPTVLRSSGIS